MEERSEFQVHLDHYGKIYLRKSIERPVKQISSHKDLDNLTQVQIKIQDEDKL